MEDGMKPHGTLLKPDPDQILTITLEEIVNKMQEGCASKLQQIGLTIAEVSFLKIQIVATPGPIYCANWIHLS